LGAPRQTIVRLRRKRSKKNVKRKNEFRPILGRRLQPEQTERSRFVPPSCPPQLLSDGEILAQRISRKAKYRIRNYGEAMNALNGSIPLSALANDFGNTKSATVFIDGRCACSIPYFGT
jgi:hypothetical protein